jgi:opacity protein-like surface antigen
MPMMRRWLGPVAAGLLITAPRLAAAQQPASPATVSAAGMDVHGSAEVGYRFTDTSGSSQTFHQLFDLSEGTRLFGLELRGEARADHAPIADTFVFSASGLGGDPFPTLQFTARKARRYDLRVNWRRSRFFSAAPITPNSIDGLDTRAVTDRHQWSTSRRIADVALTVDASSRLHLQFGYARVSRSGSLDSTRSLDFVGSPSTWGAFARANPYPVVAPIDDSSNRVSGGLTYGGHDWTVHYQAGYQRLSERQVFAAAALPERSINLGDAVTANESLSGLSYDQDRRLSGPFSELSYVARLHPRIEWRGDYLYSRYRGPFGFNARYQGSARTTGTAVSPYDVTATASGETSAPNQMLGQGVAYALMDRWKVDLHYQYSRMSSDTSGELSSLLAIYPPAGAGSVPSSETDDLSWRQAVHALDLTTTWEPTAAWTIKPGVRVSRRDIEMRADGTVDPATSERIRTVFPELTVGYRPDPRFSARGSYTASYSDAAYTRLSPAQRTVGRVSIRLQPVEALTIDLSANRINADLFTAAFTSHTRLAAAQISYSLSDRLTVLGGLDYQTFLGLGSVSFLRGTLPIADDQMTDREIDRIWQGGATVKVSSRVGITASGNFQRTTGTDSIVGEPPLYGASTFPYVTASAYVDLPRAGRLTLDVQRTYLFQELLPLNDFRATLVTIRYSHGF